MSEAPPPRTALKHLACGTVTQLDASAAAALARNPAALAGAYCAHCGRHFQFFTTIPGAPRTPAFAWADDGTPVGTCAPPAPVPFDSRAG